MILFILSLVNMIRILRKALTNDSIIHIMLVRMRMVNYVFSEILTGI